MTVAVTGASGTLVHGGVLAITGSGFGSKATAAPWFWDTVENQAAYSALSDGDTIPTGGANPWETSHGWNVEHPILYSTSRTMRRAGKSAMYTSAAAENGGSLGGKHIDAPNWYMSWWWRPNQEWQPDGSSNKILRLSNDGSFGDPGIMSAWTKEQFIIYESDNGGYHGSLEDNWVSWGGNLAAWNRQEVVVTNRTSLKIFTNKDLVRDHTTWTTALRDIDGIYTVGVDWNLEAGMSGFRLDIDEIYIDKGFQRVEIGNASTWAAVTSSEVQPPSAWSDTGATITVNQGSIATLSAGYLYVFDASGTPNSSGFALTGIGGEPESSPIIFGIRR